MNRWFRFVAICVLLEIVGSYDLKLCRKPWEPSTVTLQYPYAENKSIDFTYTENCSGSCHWEGSKKRTFYPMDMIEFDLKPSRRVTLACSMYTYHGAHENILNQFLTWGRYCDIWLPFSDEEWTEPGGLFKTIPLRDPPADGKSLWSCMRKAWTYLADRLDDGTLAFDYLVVGGDDQWWVMENLRSFLASLTPNDHFLGGVAFKRRFTSNPFMGTFPLLEPPRRAHQFTQALCPWQMVLVTSCHRTSSARGSLKNAHWRSCPVTTNGKIG